MERAHADLGQIIGSSKRLGRILLVAAGNRIELLKVEVQEGRARLLRSALLAFATLLFGCSAWLALNVALVVLFWPASPVGALLGCAGLHAVAAVVCACLLRGSLGAGRILAESREQIRKDVECLAKHLV